jgi:hypothetical protein
MINLTMHNVDRITVKKRKHPNVDTFFYTTELAIRCITWDGHQQTQHIALFSDKPLEIEDADSTSPLAQDV